MLTFNTKNVNEQMVNLIEQLNAEDPSHSIKLEMIKSSHSYGENVEISRCGIAYDSELEEALNKAGYLMYDGKKYSHSKSIILEAKEGDEVYLGYAFAVPNRYDEHKEPELFVDLNTFKRKL